MKKSVLKIKDLPKVKALNKQEQNKVKGGHIIIIDEVID